MSRDRSPRAIPGMGERSGPAPAPGLALRPVLAVAAVYLVLEVALNGFAGYGYFGDELYYLACSKRLGLGFVDHPPLAPLLLRGVRALLGESLPAIRLPAAIAGAATVVLAGRMAARFGGTVRAQVAAAASVAVAPGLVILFGFFSTNAFEILAWTVTADLVLALLGGADPRLWLAVGAILGLGLENKHTTAMFGAALAAALVATSSRRHLRSRWPWLGMLVALLLFLPNLLWEFRHDGVSLEFYRNAIAVKNVPTSPLRAAGDQLLFMNPALAPLWLLGSWYLLFDPAGKRWRAIGATFALLFALVVAVPTSRPDRIAGAYPMLLAAGAVRLARPALRRARVVLVVAVAGSTAVLAPLALPILPPASLARYAAAVGINPPIERQRIGRVPQWVADRLGWDDLAAALAEVRKGLPAADRADAAVLAGDYAYAGAAERFGSGKGIGRVIGTHNQYYLWGPGEPPPTVVVALGYSRGELERVFDQVDQAATFRCELCYQDGMPIWVARRPRISLAAAWPDLKRFE